MLEAYIVNIGPEKAVFFELKTAFIFIQGHAAEMKFCTIEKATFYPEECFIADSTEKTSETE